MAEATPSHRKTRQFEILRDLFDRHPTPLSIPEILALLRPLRPSIGLATVYRHVAFLLESGWIEAVHLPGQPCRYERSGLSHHHHFLCHRCRRVLPLLSSPADLQALLPKGFVARGHVITLYGYCPDCLPPPHIDP